MKDIKQFILESHPTKWLSDWQMLKIHHNRKKRKIHQQNKYFTEEEKGKILKDTWDKDGEFYKMLKKMDIKCDAPHINQYFDNLLDDDRLLAGFAEYISSVIGRHNFSLEQVQKFINTEDLKG